MGEAEILVFGGGSRSCFSFDWVRGGVDTYEEGLSVDGAFGQNSDYLTRLFGNFLYSIDGSKMVLHVYSMKDKVWNYSSLSDLGVN